MASELTSESSDQIQSRKRTLEIQSTNSLSADKRSKSSDAQTSLHGSSTSSQSNELNNSVCNERLSSLLAKVKTVKKKFGLSSNKTVYITTELEKEKLISVLNSPTSLVTNIFKKVISHPDCVQVILNKEDQIDQLKGILGDVQCDVGYQRKERAEEPYRLFILDFNLPSEKSTRSDLRKLIVADNPELELEEKAIVIKRFKYPVKVNSAVIEFRNPAMLRRTLDRQFIRIYNSTVEAVWYYPVAFCSQCCEYEHSDADCKVIDTECICVKCSEIGHKLVDCKSSITCCFYCYAHGRDSHSHFASSPKCPYRLDLMDHLAREKYTSLPH